MQRWIWVVLAFCVSTAVYFTIRYGLRPKPIPVMNATEFTNLKQIGVVTYKRLRQNIRSERVVLLGSSTDVKNDNQIWLGLMEAAAADKEKIVFFRRSDLAAVPGEGQFEIVPFTDQLINEGKLFEEIKTRVGAGHLVVVYGWTHEISHLIKGSLSQHVDKIMGHPVLSISTLPLILNLTDDDASTECLTPTENSDDSWRLTCASHRISRKVMKKNPALDRIWAVTERHGLKEFLLFVHEPPAPPAEASQAQ